MSKPSQQRYYWAEDDCVTCCLLQNQIITAFTSLYVIQTAKGYVIKERYWEHENLVSERQVAIKPSYFSAIHLFLEEADAFNTRMFKKYAIQKNRMMRFPVKTRSPLAWSPPKMGERVTCLQPVEAYYSGYAGNPHCFFEPGDIGNIGAVDVPAVYSNPQNRSGVFACIDFEKPAIPTYGRHRTMWRCSMYYHHIVHLSP